VSEVLRSLVTLQLKVDFKARKYFVNNLSRGSDLAM